MNKLIQTFLRSVAQEGLALSFADDAEDFLQLHAAADAFLRAAPSREYLKHLEPELHIGGVVLRRLSIGARDFFNERPAAWFDEDREWYMRSLFYCLAEGRDPAALWAYETQRAWTRQVRRWSRKISANWREMSDAVTRFLQIEEQTGEETEGSAIRRDYGALVEMLCSEYGHDPEYWIWRCPEETVDMLWSRLVDRKDREARAASGKGAARDPDTPATRALFRYRDIEERFLTKLRARHGG